MDQTAIIKKILSANFCGDIFERDEAKIKERYREYAKYVHPDICTDPKATEAIQKLNKFYESALSCISTGTWEETNKLYTDSVNGLAYRHYKVFELGIRYVSNDWVTYVLSSKYDKFVDNFRKMSGYSSVLKASNLEKHFGYKVPGKATITNRTISIPKRPLDFPMDAFLSAYKDKLTAQDIAWMISRMCDLLCAFSYMNVVTNSIKPENLFINTETHEICMFGGWWYASEINGPLIGTTKDIFSLMPNSAKTDKKGSLITDAESVKAMFREIVKGKKDIPRPMIKWLNSGSSDDPVAEFNRWDTALTNSFGNRRFVEFKADADIVYGDK